MVDFAKLMRDGLPPRKSAVPSLVIAVTGHRPPRIGGYEWSNPVRQWCRERLREETERLVAHNAPGPPCTCRDDARRDPECPLGKSVGSHFASDWGRAEHLDSYLRRARWQGQWTSEAWRRIPMLCLSGGALGTDQDACGVWLRMGLPYVVVEPFPDQGSRWPQAARETYGRVLAHAAGVVTRTKEAPSDAEAATKALHARNDYLVYASDEVVAVWDGSADGGTASCVRSCRRAGREPVVIDPREALARR